MARSPGVESCRGRADCGPMAQPRIRGSSPPRRSALFANAEPPAALREVGRAAVHSSVPPCTLRRSAPPATFPRGARRGFDLHLEGELAGLVPLARGHRRIRRLGLPLGLHSQTTALLAGQLVAELFGVVDHLAEPTL